jgi:oxygen-dependent protoporphyrinogen oxidase
MSLYSIIIGAGISGLVAAYRLKELGREVLLLESSDRVGGVIQSREAEGFLIEGGPNSLRGSHEFLGLIDELGLKDDLVTADPRAPAYVYLNHQLHPVPMSPPALIRTKLLSTSAKLRLLREPFIRARREPGEESIASFVRRRLGPEVLEHLVAPFLSGVYAGEAEQLSLQACFGKLAEFEAEAGSILRGALRAARKARVERDQQKKLKRSLRPYRLCSFRRGLQTLPQALARALGDSLLTEARIIRISTAKVANATTRFEVTFEQRGEQRTLSAITLIVATPAYVAAKLLEECAPEISALVADIPYVPLASVPLGYRREQVAHRLNGFGVLAPRSAGLRTLGSVWNSSLFPGRAPAGWVCLTSFIGGATDWGAISLTDEELIRIVHCDLQKVLGIRGEACRLPITRHERAIPQYVLGHAARVAKITAALHNRAGLRLAGNYLRGVSLGDCIKQAEQTAREISREGD